MSTEKTENPPAPKFPIPAMLDEWRQEFRAEGLNEQEVEEAVDRRFRSIPATSKWGQCIMDDKILPLADFGVAAERRS